MTEAEFMAGTDPADMLSYLTLTGRHIHAAHMGLSPGASERKLRLFACACCRAVWHLLTDARSRRAVEVAEHYAEDGKDYYGRVLPAVHQAYAAWSAQPLHQHSVAFLAWATTGESIADSLGNNWFSMSKAVGPSWEAQASLLRDVVGNPFAPITFDPAWRTPDVTALARAAYEERPGTVCPECGGRKAKCLPDDAAYSPTRHEPCYGCGGTGRVEDGTLDPVRLLVLADALEDSGCADQRLLRHLRMPLVCPSCGRRHDEWFCAWCGNVVPGQAVHVRGCAAVDLCLGLA